MTRVHKVFHMRLCYSMFIYHAQENCSIFGIWKCNSILVTSLMTVNQCDLFVMCLHLQKGDSRGTGIKDVEAHTPGFGQGAWLGLGAAWTPSRGPGGPVRADLIQAPDHRIGPIRTPFWLTPWSRQPQSVSLLLRLKIRSPGVIAVYCSHFWN